MKNSIIGKKGIGASQIALLIIVLSAAILMIVVLTKLQEKTSSQAVIDTCRLSVLAQAATEWKPGVFNRESFLDVNCDKRYVTFYDDKATIGYDPDASGKAEIIYNGKKTKKFLLNDFIVNQVIAEEMRICNYQFLEGKQQIWVNDESLKKNRVCFVCSEIKFDKSVEAKEFSGLFDYIRQTRLKSSTSGSSETYFEYFNQEKNRIVSLTTWNETQTVLKYKGKPNIFDMKLDPSKTYAVIYYKGYNILGKAFEIASELAVFGWFTDAPEEWSKDAYLVTIVPQDELNSFCEIQVT